MKRLRNSIKISVRSRLEMKMKKGLWWSSVVKFYCLQWNLFHSSQFFTLPTHRHRLESPIGPRSLHRSGLQITQAHTHTHIHTHNRTPLDIYQLEAGTFTHNTQQRQTFMPPPDSNPQIRQLNGCKPTSSSQSLTKLNKRKHRTFPTSLSNSKFRCFEVKCVPQTWAT